MKKIGRRPTDDQLLEGGGGGSGSGGFGSGAARSSTRERVEAMTPKERATLENPGKQFEGSTPAQATATEKARKVQESLSPKERAELEKVGEQFRAKKEKPNPFEMSDAERAALTPAQRRKYGSDVTFKKGGKVSSASSRGDGIAQRGKTKGRMY
jgi:hypothetical protein